MRQRVARACGAVDAADAVVNASRAANVFEEIEGAERIMKNAIAYPG